MDAQSHGLEEVRAAMASAGTAAAAHAAEVPEERWRRVGVRGAWYRRVGWLFCENVK